MTPPNTLTFRNVFFFLKEKMHRLQALFLVFFFYLSIIFIASVWCDNILFNLLGFDDQIVHEGDALFWHAQLRLTAGHWHPDLTTSVGRATYHKPMHHWDKSTG